MALWENLGKKTSETTAKAIQKAKELSETSRLNSMISEEEKKINNNYYQIGKLYASLHQHEHEEAFAGMIASISESEGRISDYRKQVQDVKGVMRCEKCGAEVPRGVAFCSSCGTPMPKGESVDMSKFDKCESCGAMVEKGMRFCTSCGKPMAPAAASEAAPAEEQSAEKQAAEEQAAAVIESVCPSCGTKLDNDTLFCTECGIKL